MTQNTKNTKTPKTQIWQNWWIHAKIFSSIFKHFYEYPNEKLRYRDLIYLIFKAFGMTNLQYEIRSPQKFNSIVTMIENVYYENYWNRLYLCNPKFHLYFQLTPSMKIVLLHNHDRVWIHYALLLWSNQTPIFISKIYHSFQILENRELKFKIH